MSHRATAIKCAKEQLRMASPAEREMREMLMRIGGDVTDERFKHGVPRLQDLTQQQQKHQPIQDPRQQERQEPAHQRQESRPNQEPQQTPRQKQRVRVQSDSDDDGWTGKATSCSAAGSQKTETDQGPLSALPPVPEENELHAWVI